MFNGQARQDEFVAHMLNFKKDGWYLDIGSAHPTWTNNTYSFEQNGWKGICIEADSKFNNDYVHRNCKYINQDATKIDYKSLFETEGFPLDIDYLSLDVDGATLNVLRLLPLSTYKFKVITIEHDYYLNGDKLQFVQREILSSFGYKLLCADVFVPYPDHSRPNCSFEDWWIHPMFFSEELIASIESSHLYPENIISKFKKV